MRLSILLLMMLLLGACQPAYLDGRPNPQSPYFDIPSGSELVLHEPLEVIPRSDRVYLQKGRALPWHEVDRYAAYCAFALEYAEPARGEIAADRFTVLESNTRYLFRLARAEPLRLASAGALLRTASRSDDDGIDDYQVQATELVLHSDSQPRVKRLICANWRLPQGAPSVTLNSIAEALGERASLRVRTGESEPAQGE